MAAKPRFALYCSTRGSYFFEEIRHLLACGLTQWGAEAKERNERDGFSARADWHVIVGAQDFFYMGAGARLRTGPWPPGVILYNAEQPKSEWFSLARRLMPRAHAVWDMDLGTARLWAREGWRASHLPLGWVDGCRLFKPVLRLPRLPMTRALKTEERRFDCEKSSFAQRPLDLFFAGSRVPRRESFFKTAAPLLRRYRSLIRLTDDSRFLRPRSAPAHTRAMLGLAQRAKIALNIHRQETDYFEGHRVLLHGIGQGALVISEPANGTTPFKAGRDFVAAIRKEIPEAVRYFLSSDQGLLEAARIAAQGRKTYRGHCRLAELLPRVVAELDRADRPAARRARRREQTAALLMA